MASEESVKKNRVRALPLTWPWLCAGLALSACAVLIALTIDYALPEPLTRATGHPEQFIAQIAHEHLVNLTAVGPRVAGSYENEVVSVGVLVSAIKSIAAQASVHNHVELDVQRASGSFALDFMDGMNNVYRDVQSVVARVRGAGGRQRGRTAILLNCHFDTVPDSPGASDDGAGCAVLLEVLRALAAARRPLRHDAIFLFNGAEENIMQASHAFITQHKWARSVRAFINIEACGAGGREVMFQAGPHDPWIVEVYAGAVPHPFASSLAQELFQSGAIPADTDFRIFRDFGELSGVDLAWSANGYVYHTRLDTPERVPPAALQRTGDNVLALASGLLASDGVSSAVDPASRQPAFFDVLGLAVLSARAPAALALVAATLALLLLKIHLNARDARRRLYLSYGAWWRQVGVAAAVTVLACAGGVAAAAGVATLLHALGARLSFYSRPLLLVPLYAAPGLAACWALAGALWAAWGGWAGRRGGWGARALHDAGAALSGAALAACAAGGLRSGFLPLLWTLLPAGADALGGALRVPRGAAWALGAALPLLQTAYLLLNTLRMFVPIMGRAGAGALPPDVSGDGAADGGAGAGGAELAAAARGGHQGHARAGVGAGGRVRAGGGAGGRRAAGSALQRRAPAAPHGVPHAPHAAPARPSPPSPPRRAAPGPRTLLLGARARRQHAPHAAPPRGRGGGAGRGGVRALGVLRRAVLPARAGAGGALVPRGRARRAARAPARQRDRGAARGRAARAAAGRVAGAAARGGRGGAGAGPAPGALQRAGGAAGGRAVGRAPLLLLRAARGARARRLAPPPGAARRRRHHRHGARVAGGPRALRARAPAAAPRAPAAPPARAHGAHGLGRGPAPLRPVTAPHAPTTEPTERSSTDMRPIADPSIDHDENLKLMSIAQASC